MFDDSGLPAAMKPVPSANPLKRALSNGWFHAVAVPVAGAILFLATFVSCNNIAGGSNDRAAKVQLESLAKLIEFYKTDTGSYPSTQVGLGALLAPPPDLADAGKWKGPYVANGALPSDPWGNPYDYTLLSEHTFRVRSLGEDGLPDTSDDIMN